MLSILAVTTSVGRLPVQLVPGNHTGDCWYQPGLVYLAVSTAKQGGSQAKLVKRDKGRANSSQTHFPKFTTSLLTSEVKLELLGVILTFLMYIFCTQLRQKACHKGLTTPNQG
jgi:hypothetical protein